MIINNAEIAGMTKYQDKLLKQYFQLSNPLRSIAGQIAVQHHLQLGDYASMAAFIKSFNYDPFDNLTKKYGNFWYKLMGGRSLTQQNTCIYFLNSVDMFTAKHLNHYLWHFIDQAASIEKTVACLPRSLKRQILNSRNRLELSEFHSFQNFKQSYPKGRENLYNQQSLHSFTALLLIALRQKTKLKHSRPTSAEKIAYAQFLYLFGYKYRILKKQNIGQKINLLLSSNRLTSEERQLSINPLKDFDQVEEILKVGIKNSETDLSKYMSEKIKEFITSQPDHSCFTNY
jgi:hypothetical protein